ncbi:CAP domain-containing protein [Fusarium flagelliforme]|uniref:Scp-like extracellular protein n=1 Tax=Fusarium flagelliforme TaxID=2675880 RepID=A0A395MEB1_9HYPO|nr:CAP domain-containing protein [Fusarium flagelliforme]KAH7193801.1 CAP domain-containing protein [Fusarium flagelliforme]RFN46175.1 scp-like extracellular protein [Fusarium flagelliforme]
MLFSTIFNPSSLLMGLQLLSGVMASPIEESTGSLVARDLTLDQSKALAAHNGRRRQLGIAPLVWDTGLEAAAQKHVQSLADTKARYIISPVTTRMDQGENSRAFTWTPGYKLDYPMERAASGWIDGQGNYKNYGGNKYNLMHQPDGADYFTQAVWRATTKVGIATARYVDDRGYTTVYVIARYSVRGNIYGQVIW